MHVRNEPALEKDEFPPAGRGRRLHGRRGAVLLMILVMIVVLSAIMVQFTEKGMTEIIAEGHYVERNRLRLTAFSALETTLAVMADVIAIEGGLTSPAQGWSDPLAVAGFNPGESLKVDVSFVDESGKLPLGTLDEGTLYLLFNEMGLPIEESLKLTHSLLDWIDEDDEPRIDGAESETYAAAEWPYAASNRPVERLSELAVVEGFRTLFFDEAGRPNELFRQFADTVSVHADGTLNANSISDLALRAYGGFGDPQVNAMRQYLVGADGIRGTADDRYFARAEEIATVLGPLPAGASFGVTTQTVRVRVHVHEADSHYVLEAVVQPSQGGATAAPAPNAPVRPPGRTPVRGGQSTQPSSQPAVPYPFVFLELTEDVGYSGSLAAPAEDGGATDGDAASPKSAYRG